ncbi:hypothetical protein LNAOJCKE_3041 [Methylorubrum aminovorans]|uniref:Uncharacterized protein n=1 Tax=Methylorubrum aminovorans TaxID=269069 RepID=A0ABQ4UGZ3_9HYPH|nr:hypothetical protein LNAOJCKE_3041 [Methylorubrum aminovorans]
MGSPASTPAPRLRVLSLGAGVQSTTLAVAACGLGENVGLQRSQERVHAALFFFDGLIKLRSDRADFIQPLFELVEARLEILTFFFNRVGHPAATHDRSYLSSCRRRIEGEIVEFSEQFPSDFAGLRITPCGADTRWQIIGCIGERRYGLIEGIEFALTDVAIFCELNNRPHFSVCVVHPSLYLPKKLLCSFYFLTSNAQSIERLLDRLLTHLGELCNSRAHSNCGRRKCERSSNQSLISIEPKLEAVERSVFGPFFQNRKHILGATESRLRRPPGKSEQEREHQEKESGEAPIHALISRASRIRAQLLSAAAHTLQQVGE